MKLSQIESKVIHSTMASAVVGVAVAVLNDLENNHALLGSVPAPAQSVILTLIPPLASFLAGWSARHTPRNTAVDASGPVKGQ